MSGGRGRLPSWRRLVAVVAHPDDESFGLGAVIDAFVREGAEVSVLCLTRGEASTLGEGTGLAQTRARELAAAGERLGVRDTHQRDWPDGDLQTHLAGAVADVGALVAELRPDGLLGFDPSGVTGHPDHRAATLAAMAVAEGADLPVLAWTLSVTVAEALNAQYGAAFTGHTEAEVDIVLSVDRTRQRLAIAEHASQATPGSVLWRRLELLGDHEHLRWLRATARRPSRERT